MKVHESILCDEDLLLTYITFAKKEKVKRNYYFQITDRGPIRMSVVGIL